MSKCKGGDSSIIQIYKKTPIMTAFYIKRVLILREPWRCLGGGTISWLAFINCVGSVNLPLSFQVFDLVTQLTGRFSAWSMKVLLYYLCEDAESLWTQVLIHRVLDHKRHLLQMRTCTYKRNASMDESTQIFFRASIQWGKCTRQTCKIFLFCRASRLMGPWFTTVVIFLRV